MLLRIEPSPLVALNRAMAVAMRDGPEVGLALLDDRSAAEALRGYLPSASRGTGRPAAQARPGREAAGRLPGPRSVSPATSRNAMLTRGLAALTDP